MIEVGTGVQARRDMHMKTSVLIAAAVLLCFLSSSGSSRTDHASADLPQPVAYRQRDSTVEEVIDFLSEDAIQACLAHRIFEDPTQVYSLPFEEERVKYFSSDILCFHLTDDCHIYVRSHFSDGQVQIDEMNLVNDKTAEHVFVPPELCPSIWERLI